MTEADEFIFEDEPEVEVHANRMEYADVRHQLSVQMLKKVRDNITHVIQLLETGDTTRATRQLVDLVSDSRVSREAIGQKTGSRVVEGVFDGVFMVGSDGVRYDVAHNYASKSRLVQGDMLKLTIQPDGSYLYKQIGPIDRQRIVGILQIDASTQEPVVQVEDRVYKVLSASVSYHKGVPGDEMVVLVPRDGLSDWAAVETVVNG